MTVFVRIEVVGVGTLDILGRLRHFFHCVRVRLHDGVSDCSDGVDESILECVVDEQMLVEVQGVYEPLLFDLVLHPGKVLDAVAVLDLVIVSRACVLASCHCFETLHVQRGRGVHQLILSLYLVIKIFKPLKSVKLPHLRFLLDHLRREYYDLGISLSVGHISSASVLARLCLV